MSIRHQACGQPRRRQRRGFTLVEMLVVIAIIVTLIGLLLPAIQAARSAAQSTQCQSNLRQLGLAITEYRDQNGAYPQYRAEYPPITNAYGVYRPRWQWIMASQLGGWAQNPDVITAAGTADTTYTNVPLDNKIFVCPSMSSSSISSGNVIPDVQSIRNGSYGYNFGYLGNNRTLVDGDNTTPTLRYPVTSVKEPGRTIAFGDSRGGSMPHGGHSMTLDPPHMVVRNDKLSVNSPYWQQPFFGGYSSGVGPAGVNPYGPDEGTSDITVPFSPAEARHAGKANVVFLDGHVESLSLATLGYALSNGVPQCQTTATPLAGADNALWTGRGLDEFSPNYAIEAPLSPRAKGHAMSQPLDYSTQRNGPVGRTAVVPSTAGPAAQLQHFCEGILNLLQAGPDSSSVLASVIPGLLQAIRAGNGQTVAELGRDLRAWQAAYEQLSPLADSPFFGADAAIVLAKLERTHAQALRSRAGPGSLAVRLIPACCWRDAWRNRGGPGRWPSSGAHSAASEPRC